MSRAARDELRARVHRRLLAESPASPAVVVAEEAPLLPSVEVAQVVDEVLADMHGLGRLDRLLADPSVTEVIVNGDGRVWVERAGRLVVVGEGLSHGEVHHLVEKIVAPLGLRADRSSPLVDARLPDGSRVNAVLPPLAVDGPCLTVRRFPAAALGIEDFCAPPIAALLRWAVTARANIVVTGATSSGKTSLLGALASGVAASERVVTVEDAAELRLQCDHVVRLEARPANAEGAGEVTVRDLVRNALRMRPDRIVLGEVRGGEAFDLVQAMNTGHDGSLSTCHANGPLDALRRLETLALLAGTGLPVVAVREQLLAAVDLIVHVARGTDGRRSVVEVCEPVLPAPDEPPRCRVRRVADAAGAVVAPARRPRAVGTPPFACEVAA